MPIAIKFVVDDRQARTNVTRQRLAATMQTGEPQPLTIHIPASPADMAVTGASIYRIANELDDNRHAHAMT